MLRLFSFGGLWLESEGGERPPAPPRRLALLALVATAGRKGISRDRVLALFWPEAPEEKARHSLSQTLYSLRKELGCAPITEGTDLLLDPAIATADISEFLAAADRRDVATMGRLYTGPFLDGFHLAGSVEFEEWADEQRTRLRDLALKAIESLADAATASGAHLEAADHWRHLARLEPLNARFAERLMRALALTGDRAGALSYYRRHEALVRAELDTAPETVLVRLAGEMRQGLHASPLPPGPTPLPQGLDRAPQPLAEPPTPAPAAPVPPRVRTRPSWSLPVLGGIAVLMAVAATVAVWLTGTSARAADEGPVFAVGIIRDRTAEDSTEAEVLSDMVATSLATVEGLRVIGTSRLYELMPRDPENPTRAVSEAARQAGGTDLIEGELNWREGGGYELTLRRVGLESGLVAKTYRAGGLDRISVVDSASRGLARALGGLGDPASIAQVSTSSPVAYRLYEEGLRAFFQWDLAAARRLMEAALAEDPAFAMAAYYAWWADISLGSTAADRAQRVRDMAGRLPDRDRLLVVAHTGVTLNDPAALPHADTLAVRYPDDPQAAYVAGIVHSHASDYPGAIASFRRAVAMDLRTAAGTGTICRLCLSLVGLAQSYFGMDSLAPAEAAVREWIRLRPKDPAARDWLVAAYVRRGAYNEALAEMQATDSLRAQSNDLRLSRLRILLAAGEYDRADAELQASSSDPSRAVRDEVQWLRLISLRNQGRYMEASAGPSGTSEPFHRAILAFETRRHREAIRAFRTLAEEAAANPLPYLRARNLSWRLMLAGMAYAAAGDTATLRRLADSVEAIGRESLFGRDPALHWFLRGQLSAARGDSSGAAEAYRRSIVSPADGFTRANLELGRLLVRSGRAGEAIPLARAALHGGLDGSNLYVTRTELHELLAQAHEQAGNRDSAAVHYRAVADAWRGADPAFAGRSALAAARSAQRR